MDAKSPVLENGVEFAQDLDEGLPLHLIELARQLPGAEEDRQPGQGKEKTIGEPHHGIAGADLLRREEPMIGFVAMRQTALKTADSV